MGCKSCKKNKSSNVLKAVTNIKKGLTGTSDNLPNNEYNLLNYEKVLLVIFGWIPLGFGYYYFKITPPS